jgi:hypothetical protein
VGHSSWWRVDGVSGGGGLEEFDLDGQHTEGFLLGAVDAALA